MRIICMFVHQGLGPGIQVELPHFLLERHALQQVIDPPLDGYLRLPVRENGVGGLPRSARSSPGQAEGAGCQQDGSINDGPGGSSLPLFRLKIFPAQLSSFGS
jgi:hypothetical protein